MKANVAKPVLRFLFSAAILSACSKKGAEHRAGQAEEGAEQEEVREGKGQVEERAELSQRQQSLVDKLRPGQPLLPVDLARALLHAPREWGEDILRRVYPDARVVEDNPRVNLLLELSAGGGEVFSVDLRLSIEDAALIGSVVLTYGPTLEQEALIEAVRSVADPKGESQRVWLLKDGSMRISHYAKSYEGGTRVTFEPVEQEGKPIAHPDDEMKDFPEWNTRRAGPARDKANP